MTIPIPTSNGTGVDALTSAPAGLPDESTLAALANAFFSAFPGETPAVPGKLPDSLPLTSPHAAPQPPEPVLALGSRAPSLVPAASTQTGVPDALEQSAPGAGRAGAPALGVPEAYASALPRIPSPELPATPLGAPPSSPFYFLGEASALPSSAPLSVDLPSEDRISAQSFGLPGTETLRGLLGGLDAGAPRSPSPAPASPAGNFYFLDPIQPQVLSFAGEKGAPQVQAGAHPAFDVEAVRRDFPILAERVNGRPLVWFDNAATTHKPRAVIDRIRYFYEHENSNIHRAAHELAARATDAYEGARQKVARFIGAGSVDEIVFVRGATEAINLIAKSWGAQNIGEGDEIVVSNLEHHANIVPWQQLAVAKGARLRVIPVDDSGQILLEEYRKLLSDRTKIVAVTQVSNALGTVTPVRQIVEMAHSIGAKALVDGAQSVSHMRVNVQAIDADFFVFSGHKIFGPTGIGVVYGKKAILESMPPWQGGGNMITDVTFERTLYHGAPARFEAGTGNIADAVGLGAALDYVERVGIENIARYEHDLLVYATDLIRTVPGIRLIGTAADKASVLSFVLAGYQTEAVGRALNEEGIAVRSGHHCAQPILRRFGVETTVRPSLAFYNTCGEVDRMIAVLRRLVAARR